MSPLCAILWFMMQPALLATSYLTSSGDAREDAFARDCGVLLRLQVRLSKRLDEDMRLGRPYADLEGSLSSWARLFGLGPHMARMLLCVGTLLRKRPELEPLLLSGRIHVENAALLEQLLATDGAVHEGEDWVGFAERDLFEDFRRRVDRRLAEVAAGVPVHHLGMFVPAVTLQKFRRARVLESRKARMVLTKGETLDRVLDVYLLHEDPLAKFNQPTIRTRSRRRRKLASDYVPEVEKLKVRARFFDRCAVAGCSNEAFLEFAHVKARALGGAHEARNLLLLCSRHHRMLDSGRLLLRGDVGDLHFVDRDGRRIAPLRPPPPCYAGDLWPVASTGPPV